MSRLPSIVRAAMAGGVLVVGCASAPAAEPSLKAVDIGNGQKMWVDNRQPAAAPSAPTTDTTWVDGQPVRVLRSSTASARTAGVAAAEPAAAPGAFSGPPAGARAVTLGDGSKMWVLPER